MFSKYLTLLAGAAAAFAQNGNVTGNVFDSQSGRAIPAVAIAVDGHADNRHVTDANGKFTISLSPGTYTLRFTAENYSTVEMTEVVVKAGEVTQGSTVMANKALVTSIEVVEKVTANESTAAAALNERKLSSVVSDSISREELSSGTAGDAAGALEKVTGVSVVGDGFVFVRGLGERYSATQLNGAVIPTTEPEKRVVPLDLFPSGMIESIKIAKSYTPDLPGEFSGGLVQLQTVEFPQQKMFNVSMKSGFNSRTTFDNFSSFPGGNDFWGFGKGARALPASIPENARLFPGAFTQAQLQQFGQAFSNNWEPVGSNSARPALDWSATGGGTFGRFGLVGAFSFSNKPQFQSELQRYIRQGDGKPLIFTDYPDYREYSESARLGAVFNAAIRLTPNQKILFRNTLTHDSDKTARQFSGYDGGVDSDISSERIRFVERKLFSSGVEGDHSLPNLKNSLLHWQFTYSSTNRDEPDLREVFRGKLPDGRYIFTALGSSGIRFFSALEDRIFEPQADYSIPFFKGSVSGLFKMGVRITSRQRDFQARRFRYIPQQSSTLNLFAPSNQLFSAANIRPNGFQIVEYTRGTDTYDAEMNIFAGYGMLDLAIGPRWRIVGGLRFEDASQRVRTVDNLVPNATPINATLDNRDPIPAVNVIYQFRQRQNIRVSYSRTVSRPDFRELSPFDFNNVLGGFVTVGNPNLRRAKINNYDARWEFFPGGNQLVAVSVFAKTFQDPIEQTILPSNDLRQSFINAKGARNVGFELEFRRSLGTFSKRLREFAVSSNFTFVDSNISLRPEDATILTSQNRALLGQSRYISNASLQWAKARWRSDAKFQANYVSRRISDVGTFQLPDIYQEGNKFLDFVYNYHIGEKNKWNIRFEAENLADNTYLWTQGPFDQRRYQLGRTFQIGLSYSLF